MSPTHACLIAAQVMDGEEKVGARFLGDCPLVIGQQMLGGYVEHLCFCFIEAAQSTNVCCSSNWTTTLCMLCVGEFLLW